MFTLANAFFEWNAAKQVIRDTNRGGWWSVEPGLLMRVYAINLQRTQKGIPSIFG